MLQLKKFHKHFDKLQKVHGNPNLSPIYGAGCVKNPKVLFLYMNPTARNISSGLDWKGIHAPWLGTKNVWKIYLELGLLSKEAYEKTQSLKLQDWTVGFCADLYTSLSTASVYITNLAKCTQDDARPLGNAVFKEYLPHMFDEIYDVAPNKIVSFGNQVSSVLLSKNIKVSNYSDKTKFEVLKIKDKEFKVFPVYYPVGQGMRNINLAIAAIKAILS